ncbi:hypothetical protein P43SY_010660 [Pythium insidiosum]|uniref:Uncharacterized protein n=1 Tax=Pythium insidiosum TaxID=114742 RepID=A0AAD5LXY0_PYTIN|nr:hypothetical protein P43SY_010660 [Pythium insidiosum]
MELLESAFVFVVGLVVLGGVVALGVVSAHDISPEWRTLAWSLSPMLLLPLAWIAVMHAWERHLVPTDPAMTPRGPPFRRDPAVRMRKVASS